MSFKRKSLGFAALLALAAALVLAGACRKAGQTGAEKMMERAMEKASGGKADVDLKGGKVSVKTDQGTAEFSAEGGKWPADLPADVPKLAGGKVNGVFSGAQGQGKGWTISLTEVDEAAYAKYIEALKAAGFEITMSFTMDDGASVQAKKGTTVVSVTYGKSGQTAAVNVGQTAE